MKDAPQITPPPSPTPGQRAVRWFLYGIVGVAIAIAMVFVFWLAQDPKVVDVKNAPFPVRPPVLAQKDTLYITMNYCKLTDSKGTTLLRLVGKKSIIRVPFANDNSKAGCVNQEVPITIPEYATNDVYYFEFEVNYEINPIKQEKVTIRSQEFTVQSQ